MNWIYDPTSPAPRRATVDYSDTPVHSSNTPVNSRDTPVHTSDTPASVIDISASSGAPLASPHPKKSRRRRRRRNRRSANENSAPRSAAPVTSDERWANRNSAFQRATQHQVQVQVLGGIGKVGLKFIGAGPRLQTGLNHLVGPAQGERRIKIGK